MNNPRPAVSQADGGTAGGNTPPTKKNKKKPLQLVSAIDKQKTAPSQVVVVKVGPTGGKGTKGAQASPHKKGAGGRFQQAADVWADIETQAAIDNAANVGLLASQIAWPVGQITRGRNAFCVAKLRKELGPDVCLPVAIGTSKTAKLNVVFCDQAGTPGHEHDGTAHSGLEKWAGLFNHYGTGGGFRQGFV